MKKTDDEIMAEVASLLALLGEGVAFCGWLKNNGDVISCFTKGIMVADVVAISGQSVGAVLARNFKNQPSELPRLREMMTHLFSGGIENAYIQNLPTKETLH